MATGSPPNRQKRVLESLAILFEAFRATASEVTFKAYLAALNDLQPETVECAVFGAIKTCKYCPTAGELRELCGQTGLADRPSVAWEAVLKAIPLGGWKTIQFDDPTTNAVIRNLGGWPTFLEEFRDAEGERWARKRFIDTYRSLMRTRLSDEAYAPLPGLGQAEVRGGQVVKPAPRLVRTGLPDMPLIAASPSQVAGLVLKGATRP